MEEQDPEQALAALMRRQHGVFARSQAVALGFAGSTISSRLTRGSYDLVLPGIAAAHEAPDSWRLRAMAALLWAGGDAALAAGSAAVVLGWEVPPVATESMHLLTRQRTRAVPEGLLLHRSASYDPQRDTRRVGPLRCTSPARTLVDLAVLLARRELRAVVAAAVRRRQVDASAIADALVRAGRVTGAGTLRAVLRELSPLHAACASHLEAAYVDLTAGTGLAPTAMNHPVRDARGQRRRIDAVHLPEHLPIELDGATTHTSPLDVADDQDREEQIQLTGDWLPFLRFTHGDVVHDGTRTLRRLEARLRAARDQSRVPSGRTMRSVGTRDEVTGR